MSHNCITGPGICHRCNGAVDNQLGYIHNQLWLNIKYPPTNSINFEPHSTNFKDVYIAHKVIPDKLARSAREFLEKIPIDPHARMLNDTDNKPRDAINSNDEFILENSPPDPNLWAWEYYAPGIHRAVPTTVSAFIGSPIGELITVLESSFRSTNYFDIDFSQYRKATWVLQRAKRGEMIGPHTDENSFRKFAFIYYLTDDNWDFKLDGGELVISDQPYIKLDEIDKCVRWNHRTLPGKYAKINPEFNSIVAWKIDGTSPIHWVNTLRTNKHRYTLVGFFVPK